MYPSQGLPFRQLGQIVAQVGAVALAAQITIAIVTHNMQQAARVSDFTAFMYLGELIEFDRTSTVFTSPALKQTQDYITGRFG